MSMLIKEVGLDIIWYITIFFIQISVFPDITFVNNFVVILKIFHSASIVNSC